MKLNKCGNACSDSKKNHNEFNFTNSFFPLCFLSLGSGPFGLHAPWNESYTLDCYLEVAECQYAENDSGCVEYERWSRLQIDGAFCTFFFAQANYRKFKIYSNYIKLNFSLFSNKSHFHRKKEIQSNFLTTSQCLDAVKMQRRHRPIALLFNECNFRNNQE